MNQDLSPKISGTKNALLYLENPEFADVPLDDMKASLLQLLGYVLYNELGVREATDKQALIATLNGNVGKYKTHLKKAKFEYEKTVKEAVAENRKRNKEADEAIKATLQRVKILGFDMWDTDWILAQMKGQMLNPQL
ncbi:MAG: hypothetical protein JKY08_07550 [Flavobacteriaceae bacterium]|nr:hypothetical protein [Flavobacteriaceae bacterium]